MSQPLERTVAAASIPVSVYDDGYLIEDLIRQVQAGHESAACQLREFLAKGVRWYLRRTLRETSVEPTCLQVLDSVIRAIKESQVSTSTELVSLTRTCARAWASERAAMRKKEPAVDQRQVDGMKKALKELGGRDRDALMRYFEGQQPERICSDLGMTNGTLERLQLQLQNRYAELEFSR